MVCTSYFNPLAPCGARQSPGAIRSSPTNISIHSPRAGRDAGQAAERYTYDHFNPLAPCGARRARARFCWRPAYFNPLAPCGARRHCRGFHHDGDSISIHSPRAGRDRRRRDDMRLVGISIHSPRAGRDIQAAQHEKPVAEFQSTRPVRGETGGVQGNRRRHQHFNPLAPCGARLITNARFILQPPHFNPLAPCGARQQLCPSNV